MEGQRFTLDLLGSNQKIFEAHANLSRHLSRLDLSGASIRRQTGGMGTQLTDRQVALAKVPDGKKEHSLTDLHGLSLRLLLTNDGRTKKYWVFRYTFLRHPDKMPLGTYPATTLAEARQKALEKRNLLEAGKDPKAEEREAKAKLHAETVAKRSGEVPSTLGELCERWLTKYAALKHKDKGADARAIFRNHLPAQVANITLQHLRPTHVTNLLNDVFKSGKKRTCGVLLLKLRQAVHWGIMHEYLERDVTLGMKASSWDGQAKIRERYLTLDEIKQLHHKLEHSTLHSRWKHAVWLLMATGPRIAEAMNAKLEHINLEARTWTIPVANLKKVKSKVPQTDHVIHLSDFAMAHLRSILPTAGKTYLFPGMKRGGTKTETPASEQTLTHAITDKQVELGSDDWNKKARKGRAISDELKLPGGTWTSHDLRRTMATQMGELGIDENAIDRCQAHAIGGTVRQTYQHQKKRAQMVQAWTLWGNELASLIDQAIQDTELDKQERKKAEARLRKRNSERSKKLQAIAAKRTAKQRERSMSTLDAMARGVLKPGPNALVFANGDDI